MSKDLGAIAELLLAAQDQHHTLELPSASHELSTAEAYAVQDELLLRRVARGEIVVGRKLGLTSKAKQDAMGVHEPIFGVLTDAMMLKEGDALPLGALIHPRVEPELVFVLADELHGPGITAEHVAAATGGVHLGLEVIDSRYADFAFTHVDVICDNTSAALFVVGAMELPRDLDLVALPVELERDDQLLESATGAAVLGDPREAVALCANWLAQRGESLPAGSVVLTGGLTNAATIGPGQCVTARFPGYGEVSLQA